MAVDVAVDVTDDVMVDGLETAETGTAETGTAEAGTAEATVLVVGAGVGEEAALAVATLAAAAAKRQLFKKLDSKASSLHWSALSSVSTPDSTRSWCSRAMLVPQR